MNDSSKIPSWSLTPKGDLRTGSSLFIVAQHLATSQGVPTALLIPLAGKSFGADTIELKLRQSPGTDEWSREFTVMLPGDYKIVLANSTQMIHVTRQQYLNFGTEFGIFSSAVALLVGGMLIWLIKSKQNVREK